MSQVASRGGRKANATRASLLDAALRVMARKGYSAATVGEIAQEAGVSKGLAYYHFKDKADMASATLARGLDALMEEFEDVVARSDTAAGALRGMLDAFTAAVVDNQEFGSFFFSELWREGRVWSDDMRLYEERLVRIISEQFERGQQEGTIRKDTDATFNAVSSIGLVLSTSLCYFGGHSVAGPLSKEEFVQRATGFVIRATE